MFVEKAYFSGCMGNFTKCVYIWWNAFRMQCTGMHSSAFCVGGGEASGRFNCCQLMVTILPIAPASYS